MKIQIIISIIILVFLLICIGLSFTYPAFGGIALFIFIALAIYGGSSDSGFGIG